MNDREFWVSKIAHVIEPSPIAAEAALGLKVVKSIVTFRFSGGGYVVLGCDSFLQIDDPVVLVTGEVRRTGVDRTDHLWSSIIAVSVSKTGFDDNRRMVVDFFKKNA